MANKTLLQTRTDNPAVTPIDPDECLILDQQTDQPEGEQSTVATLSELIATGGRTVTTAAAYETLYADSVVNVSAASITITVGSAMRNGSRLLIRRTAAYDGNAVTITPPAGATIEGLASVSLFGQYSSCTIERVSATLFVIVDLQDSFENVPTISFAGASTGITYADQVGSVRIVKGRCYASGRVTLTNKGSATGELRINITGAPVSKGVNQHPVTLMFYGVSYTGQYSGHVVGGGNYIVFRQTTEAGNISVIQDTNVINTAYIYYAAEYAI